MSEEPRIKYLFINMRYTSYVKLQICLISAMVIAGILCFIYTRGSENRIIKNAWWICLLLAVGEAIEGTTAVKKAKTTQSKDS